MRRAYPLGATALVLALLALVPAAAMPRGAYVPTEVLAFELRGSIVIDGDGAFTPENGVRGGSGSAADPYRISAWTIVPTSTPALRLGGTRAHAVVEDVVVAGGLACITRCVEQVVVENATNVTLRRIHVGGHAAVGIRIDRSDAVALDDVRVGEGGLARDEGFEIGVTVRRSGSVTARGVDVWATFPFSASSSRSVTLDSSTLHLYRAFGDAQPLVGDVSAMTGFSGVDSVTVLDSSFDRARIGVNGVGEARFVRNTFDGHDAPLSIGMSSAVGRVFVCGNLFANATTLEGPLAIRRFDEASVVGNRFVDNDVAFQFYPTGGSVRFERNLVTGTRFDLTAGLFQDAPTEAHDNAFVGNAGAIRFAGWLDDVEPPRMDATLNWWGDPSGPSGDGPGEGDGIAASATFDVDLIYEPWLGEAPDLSVDCDGELSAWD